MRILIISLLAVSIAMFGGCAKSKLPVPTTNMAEIYAGVDTSDSDAELDNRPTIQSATRAREVRNAGSDLSGFTRSEATELTTRFARVPNPTLAMYIFPHLSGRLPVPGYVTTFPLWDSAPYALPGETATVTDTIDP